MKKLANIQLFICAGSLNVDITFRVPRMPEEHEKLRIAESAVSYGGSAANTAYWLARLGAATQMLGCVGMDGFGDGCVEDLARVGVDVGLVQRSSQAATGMAAIFANPSSKRMVTTGGANLRFDPQAVPASLFRPGVHLHVATSLEAIALALLRTAKAGGASTSCDLDSFPSPDLVPYLDYCFINHADLSRNLGDAEPRAAWCKLGGPDLVLTQGARGASWVGGEGELFMPASVVVAVDRTGGGDAFDAGFLRALSLGLDGRSCLESGLSLAAKVIAAPGARLEVSSL